MAYEPKEWQCGDTITADDLNRIENGVADASSVKAIVFDPSTAVMPSADGLASSEVTVSADGSDTPLTNVYLYNWEAPSLVFTKMNEGSFEIYSVARQEVIETVGRPSYEEDPTGGLCLAEESEVLVISGEQTFFFFKPDTKFYRGKLR